MMSDPAWIKVCLMSSQTVTVDVREDIRKGQEPFTKIMNAAAQLQVDENLLLIAPFQPEPLFAVLRKQGFAYAAKQITSGDWEVLFTRKGKSSSPAKNYEADKANAAPVETARVETLDVDARGLEPPQPLVKILETLGTLPAGMELRARTDRRPMHLYAQLEERGFYSETEEENDGSFITKIRSL